MKIIGHRGAAGLAPGNTLRSFEKAIEHGVDEIELDVRLTKDKKLALVHDPYVTDASGQKLLVAEHDLLELERHDPELTTLEAAIRSIDRRVPIYIEVKPDVPTDGIAASVKSFLAAGWKVNDFRFGSYDQRCLLALHKALPKIQTIVIENWSGMRARYRANQLGTKQIAMLEYWLWSGYIRAVKHGGYELYCFPGRPSLKQKVFSLFNLVGTSNDPKRAKRWEKAGLAGVITDRPDLYQG